jgi:Fic family protein
MPSLYAIACLILDFLCIHPFRDGNGRVARLLTLLALYQNGFHVGRYISIERIIEGTKEDYYRTLNQSSQRWHEARHNVMPWAHFFFATVLTAYKEFSERAGELSVRRGAKTEIVRDAILKQHGDFTMTEVRGACSGVSPDMIRKVFRALKDEKKIVCLGKGKSAKWRFGK